MFQKLYDFFFTPETLAADRSQELAIRTCVALDYEGDRLQRQLAKLHNKKQKLQSGQHARYAKLAARERALERDLIKTRQQYNHFLFATGEKQISGNN